MAAFKRHCDVWRSQLTVMSQRRSLRLTSYHKMELDLPPPIFVVGMTTQHSQDFFDLAHLQFVRFVVLTEQRVRGTHTHTSHTQTEDFRDCGGQNK
jgi:hypothetical protein